MSSPNEDDNYIDDQVDEEAEILVEEKEEDEALYEPEDEDQETEIKKVLPTLVSYSNLPLQPRKKYKKRTQTIPKVVEEKAKEDDEVDFLTLLEKSEENPEIALHVKNVTNKLVPLLEKSSKMIYYNNLTLPSLELSNPTLFPFGLLSNNSTNIPLVDEFQVRYLSVIHYVLMKLLPSNSNFSSIQDADSKDIYNVFDYLYKNSKYRYVLEAINHFIHAMDNPMELLDTKSFRIASDKNDVKFLFDEDKYSLMIATDISSEIKDNYYKKRKEIIEAQNLKYNPMYQLRAVIHYISIQPDLVKFFLENKDVTIPEMFNRLLQLVKEEKFTLPVYDSSVHNEFETKLIRYMQTSDVNIGSLIGEHPILSRQYKKQLYFKHLLDTKCKDEEECNQLIFVAEQEKTLDRAMDEFYLQTPSKYHYIPFTLNYLSYIYPVKKQKPEIKDDDTLSNVKESQTKKESQIEKDANNYLDKVLHKKVNVTIQNIQFASLYEYMNAFLISKLGDVNGVRGRKLAPFSSTTSLRQVEELSMLNVYKLNMQKALHFKFENRHLALLLTLTSTKKLIAEKDDQMISDHIGNFVGETLMYIRDQENKSNFELLHFGYSDPFMEKYLRMKLSMYTDIIENIKIVEPETDIDEIMIHFFKFPNLENYQSTTTPSYVGPVTDPYKIWKYVEYNMYLLPLSSIKDTYTRIIRSIQYIQEQSVSLEATYKQMMEQLSLVLKDLSSIELDSLIWAILYDRNIKTIMEYNRYVPMNIIKLPVHPSKYNINFFGLITRLPMNTKKVTNKEKEEEYKMIDKKKMTAPIQFHDISKTKEEELSMKKGKISVAESTLPSQLLYKKTVLKGKKGKSIGKDEWIDLLKMKPDEIEKLEPKEREAVKKLIQKHFQENMSETKKKRALQLKIFNQLLKFPMNKIKSMKYTEVKKLSIPELEKLYEENKQTITYYFSRKEDKNSVHEKQHHKDEDEKDEDSEDEESEEFEEDDKFNEENLFGDDDEKDI